MVGAREHPNYETAMASVIERWPRLEGYWRGIYAARPWLLDLTDTCPRCGAEPFRGCSTPTGYSARPHVVRTGAREEDSRG